MALFFYWESICQLSAGRNLQKFSPAEDLMAHRASLFFYGILSMLSNEKGRQHGESVYRSIDYSAEN